MNLPEIRKAMCAAVKSGTDLRRAFPYLTDSVTPPSFFVGDATMTYHGAMRREALSTVSFTCWLLVSGANDRTSPEELDRYLTDDDGGIIAALEADQKLGGVAFGVVGKTAQTVEAPVGGKPYYGAQFTVEVYA